MNRLRERRVKAAAFDLDHTLFDRYATLQTLAPGIAERFNTSLHPEVTPERLARILIDADRHCVQLGWEVMYGEICRQNIFRVSPPMAEFRGYLFEQFCTTAIPFPYTRQVLTQLRQRGYQTGLITNGSSSLQRSKLNLLQLEDCFDHVIITGEYGISKPDRRVFYHMADCLGCRTSELLYVGDHPVNDVDASRRAGCIAVWVRTQGNWCYPKVERARYELDTIESVSELIREINKND